jgi:hypothetical protein
MGTELNLKGRGHQWIRRMKTYFFEEQGDSSTNFTPPPIPPAIWHLALGGLNKIHKYFIFMTQIKVVLIPC